MNTFVTSDLHLNHANIIRYCKRPWLMKGDLDSNGEWINKSISVDRCLRMNMEIVRRWNERVKPEDLVFHVGDFCFRNAVYNTTAKEWEEHLNGKIIFIKGNHDKNNSTKTNIESLQIYWADTLINIQHYPDRVSGRCRINFVGHVHEYWKFRRVYIGGRNTYLFNVGVDVNNFYPVTMDEAFNYCTKMIKEKKEE